MVGKEIIEVMAKTAVDSLARQKARDYGWDSGHMTDHNREVWRKAMTEVVKAVGGKVEGEPE